MAVDPSNATTFQMLAWNIFLGQRQAPADVKIRSITDILQRKDMLDLVGVYFDKIVPYYDFIDRDVLEQAIARRWLSDTTSTAQDAVLCGVAAIACIFCSLKDLVIEWDLVSSAKHLLDLENSEVVTVETATAWVLRTAYLRLTAKPEEAWMSSCTAMHIIDAAGLHCEYGRGSSSRQFRGNCREETRRNVHHVAQHLNAWMSFDLGRTRVILQVERYGLVLAQPTNYATELLALLPYTEILDSNNNRSIDELTKLLDEVTGRTNAQPPAVLAQCNLMFCICRRLQSARARIFGELLEKVLELTRRGLQAVYTSLSDGNPWHHVANVPFQSVCILLAINNSRSFMLLGEAMSCLEAVCQAYQTDAIKDAVKTARALVFMHQRKREADLKRQSEMLRLCSAALPTSSVTEGLASPSVSWLSSIDTDGDT